MATPSSVVTCTGSRDPYYLRIPDGSIEQAPVQENRDGGFSQLAPSEAVDLATQLGPR